MYGSEFDEIKYIDGEIFHYLGEEYILKIVKPEKMRARLVTILDKNLIVSISDNYSKEDIRNMILNWYVDKAKKVFGERIDVYSKILNCYPKAVRIKDQKTRWGSCSSKDNINLNWRLIMAPLEIIDYVIVHELCHMIQMNHSKDFWNEVEKIISDYKERRMWLKNNGIMLQRI